MHCNNVIFLEDCGCLCIYEKFECARMNIIWKDIANIQIFRIIFRKKVLFRFLSLVVVSRKTRIHISIREEIWK